MATQNDALEVLSQALKLEQEGRAFYIQAAEATLDPTGKAMFLSLADDEKLHAEMVQRQLHAIEGDGNYVLLPDLDVPAIDLDAKLFAPQKIEAKAGVSASDIDALHIAIENEIKSFHLYAQAAKAIDDPNAKQLYGWLASAETTHFNLLMSNYESLVSLGGWV